MCQCLAEFNPIFLLVGPLIATSVPPPLLVLCGIFLLAILWILVRVLWVFLLIVGILTVATFIVRACGGFRRRRT